MIVSTVVNGRQSGNATTRCSTISLLANLQELAFDPCTNVRRREVAVLEGRRHENRSEPQALRICPEPQFRKASVSNQFSGLRASNTTPRTFVHGARWFPTSSLHQEWCQGRTALERPHQLADAALHGTMLSKPGGDPYEPSLRQRRAARPANSPPQKS